MFPLKTRLKSYVPVEALAGKRWNCWESSTSFTTSERRHWNTKRTFHATKPNGGRWPRRKPQRLTGAGWRLGDEEGEAMPRTPGTPCQNPLCAKLNCEEHRAERKRVYERARGNFRQQLRNRSNLQALCRELPLQFAQEQRARNSSARRRIREPLSADGA